MVCKNNLYKIELGPTDSHYKPTVHHALCIFSAGTLIVAPFVSSGLCLLLILHMARSLQYVPLHDDSGVIAVALCMSMVEPNNNDTGCAWCYFLCSDTIYHMHMVTVSVYLSIYTVKLSCVYTDCICSLICVSMCTWCYTAYHHHTHAVFI